jgi:predicted SnoaL-like aldol condensation-catalyzing enzyme
MTTAEELAQEEVAASIHTRKEAALTFLRLASEGKVNEAFERIAPGFRHHSPSFEGDAEALKAGMAASARDNPLQALDVQHALEDGDLVAVHSHFRQQPGERGAAVVHIFRFRGDKLIELWDLGQSVPADSPNGNGMF